MKNAKEIIREIRDCFGIEKSLNILVKWEQDIREDQRKKCRDEWYEWYECFLHGTDSVVENKILNAGKSPEGEK